MPIDLEYYQEIYGDDGESYETKRQKPCLKLKDNFGDEYLTPGGGMAGHNEIDLPVTTRLITEALHNRLQGVGITDPLILARANIYQHAICNLSRILALTPLPERLRQESTAELGSLAQTLEILFSGQVLLISKPDDQDSASFEGYFSLPSGEPRRLSIRLRLRDSYSSTYQRPARLGCQIHTNPIQGITTRRKLVAAAKETELRCGLRYKLDDNRNVRWGVSIDSGLCLDRKVLSCPRWYNIFPLSQAIRAAKDNPLSGINRSDGDYTFHYHDPDTDHPDWESVTKLKQFNEGLYEIFLGMVKNHRDWAFSQNLEVV